MDPVPASDPTSRRGVVFAPWTDFGHDAGADAAVLVPVYRTGEGRLRLVLIRRALGGPHGGQVAFPGGRREPGDHGPTATALREADEEIGLPPASVQPIAILPQVTTGATRWHITPVLGRLILPLPRWLPHEREIAAVLDVAVDALAAPGARRDQLITSPTWPEPRMRPAITVGEDVLWGASLRVVDELLPPLLAGAWPI